MRIDKNPLGYQSADAPRVVPQEASGRVNNEQLTRYLDLWDELVDKYEKVIGDLIRLKNDERDVELARQKLDGEVDLLQLRQATGQIPRENALSELDQIKRKAARLQEQMRDVSKCSGELADQQDRLRNMTGQMRQLRDQLGA